MSLSKPTGFRLSPAGCYCPQTGKGRGSVPMKHTLADASHRECKAQTSSMAYSNKMIKEDHLLACTTRMLEIQARAGHPTPALLQVPVDRPLGFHPNYRVHPAFGHTPSRLPTIHLSKNMINTAANQLRFVVVNFSFASHRLAGRLLAVAFAQGRRILASPPTLSTGVAKDFSQPFAPINPSPNTGRTGLIVQTLTTSFVAKSLS
jgi:hypothetical protein